MNITKITMDLLQENTKNRLRRIHRYLETIDLMEGGENRRQFIMRSPVLPEILSC
ncbi:hypothetical protein U6B65_04810 [Oscillospiraceae bacterium MB08-C2-2]|nr:hypothetical protein U6B65_04810 [Oscillospiraceae bacterium MB08-C2-2]